jgi:hypothetical protein
LTPNVLSLPPWWPKVGRHQPVEGVDAMSSASVPRKGLNGEAPNDGLDLADPEVRDYGHPGVAGVGNLSKPAGPIRRVQR